MRTSDQGTREATGQRNLLVPRVLVFLTCINHERGEREVLLLRGAATKRLFANKYNGLGGHVEASEHLHSAAVREVREEAGIEVDALSLRGLITIDTGSDASGPRPGVLMAVFVGEVEKQAIWPTREGAPEWMPVNRIHEVPLVDDLVELLPLALGGAFFFGHYSPQPDGTLRYTFQSPGSGLNYS